jgi:hypothetical protein
VIPHRGREWLEEIKQPPIETAERISGRRRVIVDEDGFSPGRHLRQQRIDDRSLVLIRDLVQQKEAVDDIVSVACKIARIGDPYARLGAAPQLQPAERNLERNDVDNVKPTTETYSTSKLGYQTAIDVSGLKYSLALGDLAERRLAQASMISEENRVDDGVAVKETGVPAAQIGPSVGLAEIFRN